MNAATGYIAAEAALSACGRYRWRLERRWAAGPAALFVMLNPSTADAEADDPTVRKCRGFAERMGCGALVIVNLFCLRATDPAELRKADDPFGQCCVLAVRAAVRDPQRGGGPVIAAWGVHGGLRNRDRLVMAVLAEEGAPVECLGVTAGGFPRHPLMLGYDDGLVARGAYGGRDGSKA